MSGETGDVKETAQTEANDRSRAATDEAPVSSRPRQRALFEPRARRRKIRRRRRILGALSLAIPAGWVLFGEAIRRGDKILEFPANYQAAFWGGIGQSLFFWGLILFATSRRRGMTSNALAGLFLGAFFIVMGAEGAFHAVWNVYLCIDGQLHSKNFVQALFGTLPLGRPLVIFHLVAATIVGAFALMAARKYVRPGPVSHWISVGLLLPMMYGVTYIPTSYRGIQASPPDALYLHGIIALAQESLELTNESPDLRVQRRKPESVPVLSAKPSKPRNVVLILQESQRGDVVCIDPDERCDLATPFTNAVVPNRHPFMQLRSNASTTAISISNIWSGVRPTEGRELLHSVPLLWDYAHAAGYDTAYWTSQNLMFGNARQYIQDLPISHGCVATHLDSAADLDAGANDELLTERVKKDWDELKEPFFAVIHYSNIHYPYVFDEELAPFQPVSFEKSADKNSEYFNYYQGVVHRSDLVVAEALRHIRQSKAGPRTVVVYTADHGESFREHWQMGHTSALYDEEVLVRGWLDAPPGTLSAEEEASIVGAKNEFVWHLDLGPTFLDLLGLWDDPNMKPFRDRMIGHPITRPERTLEPVPMTNCTWVWECAFRNWGMMQGSRKIEAREWDNQFHCFDVANDPEERVDLGERLCAPLPDLARETFHAMPDITPPGRTPVAW